jgi:hypothetical protein
MAAQQSATDTLAHNRLLARTTGSMPRSGVFSPAAPQCEIPQRSAVAFGTHASN